MPNTALHIAVPLLILLLFTRDRRLVLAVLPMAFIPDLDWFFYHRATLHNLWLPLGFGLAAALAPRLGRPSWRPYLAAIGLFFAAEVTMDYFDDGVVLLFPFDSTLHWGTVQAKVAFIEAPPVVLPGGEVVVPTVPTPVAEAVPRVIEFTEVSFRAESQFTRGVEAPILALTAAMAWLRLRRREG